MDALTNLPHGVLFKRATTWDLAEVEPRDEERAALPDGTSDRVAGYLAWRRGMIYLGCVAGVVTAIFALISMISDISAAGDMQHGSGVMTLLALLTFAAKAVLIAILFLALGKWADVAWTRKRIRIGWAIALLTPLGIALIPLSAIMLGGAEARQVGVKDLVGLIAGMLMFIQALPALLSLFPGMLRAGMTVKTAFPGRGMGPIVGASLAPVYVIFLLVVLTPVQQLVSSFLFFVGLALFAAGPLAYSRKAMPLLRPLSPEEASDGVSKVRVAMRWFQIPGLFLILVALLSKKLFGGGSIVGFDKNALIGFWKLIDLLSSFVMMVSTYTIVAADGLIQAMHESEKRSDEVRGTEAWNADSAPIAEASALLGPIGFLAPKPEAKETEDA
ncbi:MAG: hypothetical protein QNJ98_05690 [Planctomycetota bacterium]|nr:hypothetical protein [Planctomycetota bacterium]